MDVGRGQGMRANGKRQIRSQVEWAQARNKKVAFKLVEVLEGKDRRKYSVGAFIDDELVEKGEDYNKKGAGQQAAEKAYTALMEAEEEAPDAAPPLS